MGIFRKKKKKKRSGKKLCLGSLFEEPCVDIPHAQFLLTVSVRSATAHHLLFKGSSWSSHRIKAVDLLAISSVAKQRRTNNSNSAANMNAKVSNSSRMDRHDLRDLDDQSLPGLRTDSIQVETIPRRDEYYFSKSSMYEDQRLIFPIRYLCN